MQVSLLKSKIHKAILTFTELGYEGSLAIDSELLEASGIHPYERILVVNSTNGERLETYAIPATGGSCTMGLNGAAARRGKVGDEITIMSFASIEADEADGWRPKITILDGHKNHIVKQTHSSTAP